MHFETDLFRKGLLGWYDTAHRDLPWRRTHDPYAILVSEIMLQQTQVKTVIPYYHRFLTTFPTAADLAAADEALLLKHWQGLGYYRRAKNLQAAARQIVERFSGTFPTSKQDIDSLKGVGAYTGAAVASIAFGLPFACVDGNVIRVFSRLFAIDEDTRLTATRARIQDLAQQLIDHDRPGDFNQAVMELGATTCTPRNPSCPTCPLNTFCQTRLSGEDPQSRPFKSKKVQPSKITFSAMFLFAGDRFLLVQRPDSGLMASMWELPAQAMDIKKPWPSLLRHQPTFVAELEPVIHRFTHLHATYHIGIYSLEHETDWHSMPNGYAACRWVSEQDLANLPLTRVLSRHLPELLRYQRGTLPCPTSTYALPGMPDTP